MDTPESKSAMEQAGKLAAPDPPPDKSGSAESQVPTPAEDEGKALVIRHRIPLGDESYLGAALDEHSHARSQVTTSFAVAAFKDAFIGRRQAMAECDRFRELHYQNSKTVAVLRERERNLTPFRRLQNVARALGASMAGGGASWAIALGDPYNTAGILLVAGGIVFLIGMPVFGIKESPDDPSN